MTTMKSKLMNLIKMPSWIIYFISTLLLTGFLAMAIRMYLFKHTMIMQGFTNFGYPTYIIYPLAIAKIMGLLVLWFRKVPFLTNLAYAGFFYNFILAFFAHLMINDMAGLKGPIIAMTLLLISYFSARLAFRKS